MRLVFVLSLAGAMLNTGMGPASNNNNDNPLDNIFATYQTASLMVPDAGLKSDAWRGPVDEEPELASVDRYPEGGDPMDDSMFGTLRSKLAMPVPEVPIEKICDALAAAAEEHDLPVAFLARLIWQESRFRQSAVSPVGAQGVAQFMPRTANAYGLENPFDPLAALPASARFLSELRDTFGNLGLAAAAYNGGSGRVQGWLARRIKLPEETRNYVKLVTGEAPEKWTASSNTVDLAAHLPARAPCEGIAGLSRDNGKVTMPVVLANWVGETIRKAEEAEAAARAAAAKARLMARAKGSKKSLAAKSLAAKSKGKALVVAGKSRSARTKHKADKPNLKIAVVPEDLSARSAKRSKSGKSATSKAGKGAKRKLASKPAAKTAAKVAAKSATRSAAKPLRLADGSRSR